MGCVNTGPYMAPICGDSQSPDGRGNQYVVVSQVLTWPYPLKAGSMSSVSPSTVTRSREGHRSASLTQSAYSSPVQAVLPVSYAFTHVCNKVSAAPLRRKTMRSSGDHAVLLPTISFHS